MGLKNRLQYFLYAVLDGLFIFCERRMPQWPSLFRVRLDRIPYFRFRTGGSVPYAEWAYRAGLWRALLYKYLQSKADAVIVDVGCGTGIMAVSCEYFVNHGGGYLGIDVDAGYVAFCKKHFDAPYFRFAHHAVHNGMYAGDQKKGHVPYPVATASVDAVVSISIWTHLVEEDARFYMKEIARMLKPDGHAFVTMLIVDGKYPSKPLYSFARSAYGSQGWRTDEAYAGLPETVIGITEDGVRSMFRGAGLVIKEYLPGGWRGGNGLYSQDIFVLQGK